MTIDYSALSPGHNISVRSYILDAATVAKYVDAVGDESQLPVSEDGRQLAPPMAIAALSIRGVVNDLAIPGGTLHVGQELDYIGGVEVDETLECSATLVQNSVRGGWRFMVVELEVQNGRGRKVMGGRSIIMLPG